MIALLLAGTIVLCAGLLTVVFGIPIKEFSFGNTMILAGAMIASTGIVLIGLSFVVRELRNLVRRLDEVGFAVPRATLPAAPVPADAPRGRSEPAQPKAVRNPRAAAKADVLFSREEETDPDLAEEADQPPHAPSLSPQWADEPDVRPRPPVPPRLPERVGDTGERRRDILFSSSRREQGRDSSNGGASDFTAPEPFSDRDFAPDPFEAGRHDAGRSRAEPDFAAAGRAPRNGARPHPLRRNEAPSVTVVKSGVVDTMAYSLYSDGSIEAQLPEGMVRFDSIDDLRAHLDQRG